MRLIKIAEKLFHSLEKVRVIYTDVDGTFVHDGCLFCNRSGYTMQNARAIFKLLEAGVDVVMTSGREKEKLKDTARLLGFQNYIANLGIEIVYNQGEKVITHFGVDVPDHPSLKDWIRKTGVVEALFKTFPNRVDFYQPWADLLRTHFLLVGELPDQQAQEFITHNFPELRIINNGKVAPYHKFKQPSAYHIVPKNVGKRAAVNIDKSERKLKTENLIGIGDSLEDVSVAPEVALFFLLDQQVTASDPNVIPVDNSEGSGFSRIVDFLEEKKLL